MNKIGVYVAGKINDDNIIGALRNINAGIQESLRVFHTPGLIPFSPFIDFQFTLSSPLNKPITIEDYYEYSMFWLERSDCVYVHEQSNWQTSRGTLAEIKRAEELGIPVFYHFEDLIRFRDGEIMIG